MGVLLQPGKFTQTLLTGGSGALLSLLVTSILTEFVFSREQYFTAYLVGVAVGVMYVFAIFIRVVFKTDTHVWKRFAFFSLYMTFLVVLQTFAVKSIVSIVGVDWYLVVIACVIGILSFINYFVYKNFIFANKQEDVENKDLVI